MRQAFIKTCQNFKTSLPILIATLLMVSFLNVVFHDYYAKIFVGNYLFDPIIGAIAGSVSFGIPLTSYIVGGELLKEDVSLIAITAFIMAWSTVGVAMLPLEAACLGKRFAIFRNLINFIFSIIIAILTVTIIHISH